MIEVESKILNIDCEFVRTRLKSVGAHFVSKKVFHTLLFRLPKELSKATLRLRKEGDRSVLTFKTIIKSPDDSVKVRNEMETEVENFEMMKRVLLSLGYSVSQEFEKIREEYRLDDAIIVIDQFQGRYAVIPPLLEIEAIDATEVIRMAELLGYEKSQLSSAGLRDFVVQYNLGELDSDTDKSGGS